ncbi:MAG: D-inositol-3-phosphate glycosyltransferase [Acidimicrobiaceae bacterium]|nr:D-inositol-3-phosphate glycosyltransferase [Acidimicrobiaceae bacterium]
MCERCGQLEDAVTRLAMLSLHTSPLVQPGGGDAGGMNVYVRELVAALAHGGADTTVYVRRWRDDLPKRLAVEPGFEVVHIDAGDPNLSKEQLPSIVDEFADGVRAHLAIDPADVLHANYWLSGVVGHRLKHELDLPMVSTFHTLARVKAETGDSEPQNRIDAESDVIACSDIITANSVVELHELVRHYGADPSRIEIVPPGVDHAFFSPGSRRGARQALGLGDEPVLLFVGRIQPLKGVDVAVEALSRLRDPRARMLIVGGSSGTEGDNHAAEVRDLITDRGLDHRITMVPPQPHHVLSTYYRAADVTIVPSRSESFGLVALESAACGTPVVASDVGGLRTLVDHGRTGLRVPGRDPDDFAEAVERIIGDPTFAERLSERAAEAATAYTWTSMAARLRRVYADLSERVLVDCMA